MRKLLDALLALLRPDPRPRLSRTLWERGERGRERRVLRIRLGGGAG